MTILKGGWSMLKSIQSRLIFSGILFIALFYASILFTFSILEAQEQDALLVNISGRQRMLSQRISKNLLLLHSEFLDEDAKETVQAEVIGAMALFDETLKGFEEGGDVTDTDGTRSTIKPLTGFENYLEEIENIWTPFRASAVQLIEANDSAALHYIYENNNALLAKSNSLVTALQSSAQVKVAHLKRFQLTFGILSLILFVIVISILKKFVIRPISKIDSALKEVAKGNYTIHIEHGSDDEIGRLVDSLNQVLTHINHSAAKLLALSQGEAVTKETEVLGTDTLSLAQNALIDNVDALFSEISIVSGSVAKGALSARTDIDKFEGRWQALLGQVNQILDQYEMPIKEIIRIGEALSVGQLDVSVQATYEGDFSVLMQSLLQIKESVESLIQEIKLLINAAEMGDLKARSDNRMMRGEYRMALDNINCLLDLIIKPINESAAVLGNIATGQFDRRVEGEYKGDHAIIKDALNDTVNSMKLVLNDLTSQMSYMAKGDYSKRIASNYLGEWADLKSAYNQTVGSVRYVLNQTRDSSRAVDRAAESLGVLSHELSQASTEQSASIRDIMQSVDGFANQIHNNATNTAKANELIKQVDSKTEICNQSMLGLEQSMQKLSESSAAILKLGSVINEISLQTNLLALNAAVEAARAGEHGKGFAVVAEEVRNLAVRSAKSVEETTALVEQSIVDIKTSKLKTGETAEDLRAIQEDMQRVTSLIEEIKHTSQMQSDTSQQILSGIEQISTATDISSKTAEKTANASESLIHQSEKMIELMGQFILDS